MAPRAAHGEACFAFFVVIPGIPAATIRRDTNHSRLAEASGQAASAANSRWIIASSCPLVSARYGSAERHRQSFEPKFTSEQLANDISAPLWAASVREPSPEGFSTEFGQFRIDPSQLWVCLGIHDNNSLPPFDFLPHLEQLPMVATIGHISSYCVRWIARAVASAATISKNGIQSQCATINHVNLGNRRANSIGRPSWLGTTDGCGQSLPQDSANRKLLMM